MVKFNRRQLIALGAVSAGTAIVWNWLRQETISSQPVPKSSVNLTPVY